MQIEQEEIYSRLILPVDTNISIKSVILSEENERKIQDFLRENRNKEALLKYGLHPMNRFLFYGDSGCGKTYLTKALSNHLRYTLLTVNIADAISSGDVATNISEIFKLANKYKRCIVFFDECDSIAWNRDSSSPDKSDMRRATNSLFQQMDQMDPNNVVVAATNMLHKLDPAFERRFDLKMHFQKPKENLDELFQKFLFKDFEIVKDFDETTKSIMNKRMTLSYYKIQGIVERAMKDSVLNGTLKVKESELYRLTRQVMDINVMFKTDTPLN